MYVAGNEAKKSILKEESVRVWTRFIMLKIKFSGSSCEYDNKPFGSKMLGFFNWLGEHQLPKDCAPGLG